MLARPGIYHSTGFIAAIAGPSRPRLPLKPFAQFRLASTSTPPSPRTTPKSRPITPFPPRSTSRAPSVPPVTPARQAAWPWRPAANSPPGYTDLERTIYARPFEGPLGNRVRMLWFLVPFWGLVVGFYLTTPVPPTRRAEGEEEVVELVKETPFSVLWDYSTAFLMFGTSMVCVAWLVSPSRFVTRLTQVRRQAIASSTPASTSISGPLISAGKKSAGSIGKPTGNEGEREFIRFQHGGHLMCWGELENGREVNQDEMKINLIAGQVRSPYLSLRMKTDKRLSLDAVAYRLDFRDTAVVKASEEEVVLSLSRIENVFGKLE